MLHPPPMPPPMPPLGANPPPPSEDEQAKEDICFVTLSALQEGQAISVVLEKTSLENRFSHESHLYSYIGMPLNLAVLNVYILNILHKYRGQVKHSYSRKICVWRNRGYVCGAMEAMCVAHRGPCPVKYPPWNVDNAKENSGCASHERALS